MGIIKQGILGGFSGKVAGIVGSSWKGIAVMKAMPLSVANPKTAEQIAQRGAFSEGVKFAKLILASVIKPCWDRFAQKMSGYNAWMSSNTDKFDIDGIKTPEDITISEGVLALDPIKLSTWSGVSGTLKIDWDSTEGTGNALATDEVYLITVGEVDKLVHISSAVKTRTDETHTFTDLEAQVGNGNYWTYLAFRRADGTLVSNTSFDEQVT